MTKPKKVDLLIFTLLGILVLLLSDLIYDEWVATLSMSSEQKIVVIDAGHGGVDPGKVGVNGALEKEINLSISYKLKSYLEQSGATVIMTRETDDGLYSPSASNKKREDLNKRAAIIRDSQADVVVSVHQNSFVESKYKGAMVFYYSHSEEGKTLAEYIQGELIRFADPSNARKSKANDNYFILKQTPCPAVIVESGFLSNWEDAEKLVTDEYQDKIAWSIYMGIMKYFND
jgi:N-acetylmuramoyl-L-alanine amidase